MQTYNNFPDLAKSFAKMKLQDHLDQITDSSILGLCIQTARMNKEPLQKIAETIMDGYRDCPSIVLTVVPQETIDLIKSIYP
jgi:hypothetical protein